MKKNFLQTLRKARPSTRLTPYKIFWGFIVFLDNHFPDSRMERVYPNLTFK